MKILLVHPPTNKKVVGGDMMFIHEPLSIEYIGAEVKEHHDVKIFDMRVATNLKGILEQFSPDLVGVTGFTLHVKSGKKVLQEVKGFNSEILTVAGGAHATSLPEDFYEDFIDVVVSGEGVVPFKEVVERFEKKQDMRGIKGTAVRNGNSYVRTPHDFHPGFDVLPFPARNLTEEYRENYFTPLMKPLASIKSSIGCAHRCNYCILWKLTNGRFIPRSKHKVVEELTSIKESNVFFADDDTLLDADRIIELTEQIKKEGVKKKYQVNGRADTIVKRPELIEKFREVGLTSVVMGFESYRDEDLNYFNRGSKVTTNEEALRILKENDVLPIGYFIVRPDYNKKNFEELKRYIRKLHLHSLIITVLTPIPGTDLYEETKSTIIKNDYDLYDFRHTLLPTKLPLEEFYQELAKLFEESVPRWRGILTLFKNPLHEIIPKHFKSKKIFSQIRNAHRDY